jgi:hypothetical protein
MRAAMACGSAILSSTAKAQAQERLKARVVTARVVATNRIEHLSEGLRYVFR